MGVEYVMPTRRTWRKTTASRKTGPCRLFGGVFGDYDKRFVNFVSCLVCCVCALVAFWGGCRALGGGLGLGWFYVGA